MSAGTSPLPRERITISLAGRQVEMVQEGTRWVGRYAADVAMVVDNGAWKVFDGGGITYTFKQVPQLLGTGGPFAGGAGLWLLDAITGPGGSSVRLIYDVQLIQQAGDPAPAISIDLVRVKYNPHPTTPDCFKHEVALNYDVPSVGALPKALSVVGDRVLARYRKLTSVDVSSRASCAGSLERLRRYELSYQPASEIQQERLASVKMLGRQGTAEATVSLPISSYTYGSATSVGANGNVLRYSSSPAFGMSLPSGADVVADTRKDTNSVFDNPYHIPNTGFYNSYITQNNFVDMTGDGRPDLIFEDAGQLWIARNVPGPSGTSTFAPRAMLSDGVLTTPYLEARSPLFDRFHYSSGNQEYVWRQMIDVNGDGRLDIIDAAESPGRWMIYLNTPASGGSGVKWIKRAYNVQSLYDRFVDLGLTVYSGYLPLSLRVTGRDYHEWMCWEWDPSISQYIVDPGGVDNVSGCYTNGQPAPPLAGYVPEKTFVEWEVTDINGDSYPDLVFNSSPKILYFSPYSPPSVNQGDHLLGVAKRELRFSNTNNQVKAVLNVQGMFISGPSSLTATEPFSAPIDVLENDSCGVGLWSSNVDSLGESTAMQCGFVDVNGDGIADRVTGTSVRLGTGFDFGTAVISLPKVLTQFTSHSSDCDPPPDPSDPWPYARQTSALRDVTGDGIPDFISQTTTGPEQYQVYVGTGAGFTGALLSGGGSYPGAAINVEGSFAISHVDEKCDGTASRTIKGLYDIDADGKPEFGVLNSDGTGGWRIYVYPLVGPNNVGSAEAGRVVEIDNGYGAVTKISYRSAKEDSTTAHQVPFPEIVVSKIETVGNWSLGGSLAPTFYAYGGIDLFYDSTADAFRSTGYSRRVELTTTSGPGYPSLQASAQILDLYGLEPITHPNVLFYLNDRQRWGRYLSAGQTKVATTIAGVLDVDVWSLLTVDVITHPGRISQTTLDVDTDDTRLFNYTPASGDEPCFEMTFPYDYDTSKSSNQGHYNTCTVRGFVVANAAISWRGTQAPPADASVETIWDNRIVDEFGRTTSVRLRNDTYRLDDDVCVATTYATPTGANDRVLNAVTFRKTVAGGDCSEGEEITYSEEAWEYDKLWPGYVSQGLVTAHTVYRHATDSGADLGAVREFDIDYNAAGNPIRIVKARDSGATVQTTTVDYDPFGLAPVLASMSGTGVPTLTTTQTVDPITSEIVDSRDANGTIRATAFDGFGRSVLQRIEFDGVAGVTAATSYLGFTGTDPQGRRVVAKEFTDPVLANEVATHEGRTSTTFLDELGRRRFSQVALGADYGDENLIVGARTYDAIGRVAFEADAYPASQDPSTAYGTTRYFDRFGSPLLEIRGPGFQAFNATPDATIERYPTAFSHSFAYHTEVMTTKTADALTPSAPQFGVTHESVITAVGRVLSRSTWKSGVRLEHAEFGYDGLGQQTNVVRFQNAAQGTDPVEWSWKFDSIGQLLALTEPSSAPQQRTYSDWGELTEVVWSPPPPEVTHSIVRMYDAFGRLTHTEEQNEGKIDSDTVYEYGYDYPAQTPLLDPTYVLGRLSVASGPTEEVILSYDAYGAVNSRTFVDRDTEDVYFEQHGFHADGSQAWMELNLPDNNYTPERVEYAYDTAGQLSSMWFSDGTNTEELYLAQRHDAWGRLRLATFGRRLEYIANYADVGRRLPEEVKVMTGGAQRYIAFTGFDPVGRELSRYEDIKQFGGERTHTYDAIGRLKSSAWNQNGTPIQHSTFDYDPLGNIVNLNENVGGSLVQMSYVATDRDRICRLSYNGFIGVGCNVTYDSFGNITEQPTRYGYNRLEYFNSGAVKRIENESGATATFRYDAFGSVAQLDIEDKPGNPQRSDRRYGAFLTQRMQKGPYSDTTHLSREFPGAGLVITRRGSEGPWIFQFEDSRGVRFTTNEEGEFQQDIAYAPYGDATSSGAQRGNTEFSTEQWNGGDALEYFGLVHLGARVYDPVIGRFLSRDPLLIPRTSATTNPYAFALNDPVNFADPLGLDPCQGSLTCIWTSFSGTDYSGLMMAAALGVMAADTYFHLRTEPTAPSSKAGLEHYGRAYDSRLSTLQLSTWLTDDGLVEGAIAGAAERAEEYMRNLKYAVTHPVETFWRVHPTRFALELVEDPVGFYGNVGSTALVMAQEAKVAAHDLASGDGRRAGRRLGHFLVDWLVSRAAGYADRAVSSSYPTHRTFQPGPYAREAIPATSRDAVFSTAERTEINRIGNQYGCHTCGTPSPGTRTGNWVPDHQPPTALTPPGMPQWLYPHCIGCSDSQGFAIANALRRRR
jgi:RHS repeat-associated protein